MAGVIARIGLISDTHGVLDDRVNTALADVDAIVHAGDVCNDEVIYLLETIAPVTAVAGNCDGRGGSAFDLPFVARATFHGVRVLAIHDFSDLGPIPDDVDVVVCGHSHAPRNEWHGRVLVVNPGSASQRRRMPSRSVGILEIAQDGTFAARIVMLDDIAAPA